MKINSSTNPIIQSFFGPNQLITQCSSPGRMDVMGGIADYSGSLVLQKPIKEKATVSISI